MTPEEFALLDNALNELHREFAWLLEKEHQPDLSGRLDEMRGRVAEIKAMLAGGSAANTSAENNS